MGQRGPKPLPANVHWLKGNPSKKSLADLVNELRPEIEIPGCPRHLLPEARKEWKRITPELEKYGLISKLDRSALALYCQCWARWVWAEEQLQRAQAKAAEAMADADARGVAYTGGDGLTISTPSGHMTYSPHWVIANKAMQQVHQFLTSFGLDPSSRGRVARSDNRQSDLFEGEEKGPGTGFEDI